MITTAQAEPRLHFVPDDGCSVHPACLTCPLEVCIHDLKEGRQDLEHLQRRSQARAMRGQNLSNREIATALGVTLRTVTRLVN